MRVLQKGKLRDVGRNHPQTQIPSRKLSLGAKRIQILKGKYHTLPQTPPFPAGFFPWKAVNIMGSWNETDSITNLPVKEGDPIVMVEFPARLLPLNQHSSYLVGSTIIRKGIYNEYGGLKGEDSEDNDDDRAAENNLRAFFKQSTWDKVVALPLGEFDQGTLRWKTQTCSDDILMRDNQRKSLLDLLPDYLEKAEPLERMRMLGPDEDHMEFGKVLVFLDKVRRTLITRTEAGDEHLEEHRWLTTLVNEELTILENYDPE